jgi:hypothetical protein
MHQQLWGYKVEWKSVSRGTGGKRLNTTGIIHDLLIKTKPEPSDLMHHSTVSSLSVYLKTEAVEELASITSCVPS